MKITCVVDNTASRQSGFWAEHGLSFLVEAQGMRVLFDTGQSGTVLLHNLELLGVDPTSIEALVISHAHYDHTGGLPALLEHLRQGVPLYAHPDLFRERFSQRKEEIKSIGLPLTREALARRVTLRLDAKPVEVAPGVWTSGEITPRPEPEGRSPRHLVRTAEGWAPDPYQDDMALVLGDDPGAGLFVLCGCCHAGLLNTLAHVRRVFGGDIIAVAGGLHLVSADEAHLRRVLEVLGEYGPPRLYPGHCTGERAYVALAQAFGERVAPCPAGMVIPSGA